MIRILLVEDHHLVRSGLKLLLNSDDEISVVAELDKIQEAFSFLEHQEVDMILTDFVNPDTEGALFVKEIKEKYPSIKVVLLTIHDQDKYVVSAFKLGADGYLLKNIDLLEFTFAIKLIHKNHRYLCTEISMSQVDRLLTCNLSTESPDIVFSSRELEIMQLIAEGYTNFEMSERLFLSKRTIEGHRQSLLDKTGARNSAALIRFGLQHGIIN